MLNFQFYERVEILYGENSINQLSELADHIGGTKAFIVADADMVKTGIVDKIVKGLNGMDYVIFDENEPNPPIAVAGRGFEIFEQSGCDFIIGVGGGSNMDCAKAINILRFNEAPLIQYANLLM